MTPAETQNFLAISTRYQADPVLKTAGEASVQSSIADQVIRDPGNSVNQLKALYGFVKGLDPNSAVREGEVGLAQLTQGFVQRIETSISRIFDEGGRIVDPTAAVELAQGVKDLAEEWKKLGEKKKAQYAAQATVADIGDAWSKYLAAQGADPVRSVSQQGVAGTIQPQPISIDQLESSLGQSLAPALRLKAQDVINENPDLSLDEVREFLGFKQESQTSQKGIKAPLAVKNPNPTKVIASATGTYDFTNYATDPNWGRAVSSHLTKIPYVQSPDEITGFIKKQAPKSPLTGDMVLASAQKFNVDPRLILAIAKQEANYATLGRAAKTFNPGNVGNVDSGANVNWGSWQAGLDALARNISKRKIA